MSILDFKWRGQEKRGATPSAERSAAGKLTSKSLERYGVEFHDAFICERQWWVVTDEYGALPLAALLRKVADRSFAYPKIERSRAA